MKEFLNRVFNTEFLPMSEVRKIKIILTMFLLLVLTASAIPFSIFFDYSTIFKIVVISVFTLIFVLMIFLVKSNHLLSAIHLSIIYTILLTLFYTLGSETIYAYLFFYITLVVIIFYQEIYLYIGYGFIVLLLGGYYTIFHQEGLVLDNDIPGSVALYLIFLFVFFVIFLIQILLNEKRYTDLNYEWVHINHHIDKYQEHILYYLDSWRKVSKESPFYEDLDFQKAADELATFIYEQFKDNGREITNVLDLYIYIHERGLEKILENDEFSVSTKKIANRLSKYMIDQRSEMFSMMINFHTRFRESKEYKPNRYSYHVSDLTPYPDEQILAVLLLYIYLSHEIYDIDEWDDMTKVLSKEDIEMILSSSDIEEFLSLNQIGFIKDNYDLILKYLAKKDS
ncbi:MAG: hypothetical protein AB7U79_05095 [Candidatus Izemoplasmatales bacterium]